MAYTIDTKILEQRLLTRETVIGGTSLSRCAARLQQLLRNRDKEQAPAALEAVTRDIQLYSLEIGKTGLAYNMCSREICDYESLGKDISNKVQQIEDSINHLSVELQQQQRLRRHKQECEMLAAVVNTLPSATVAQAAIDAVEDRIRRIQEQLTAKEACEQLRIKQFGLLMTSLYDLQKSLEEDSYLVQCQQQLDAALAEEEEIAAAVGGEDEDEEGEVEERRADRGSKEEPAAKKARTAEEEPANENNSVADTEEPPKSTADEEQPMDTTAVIAATPAIEEGEEVEEEPHDKKSSEQKHVRSVAPL